MANDEYPKLAELIASYFHQDYDLEGETVGEVMSAFRRVSTPAERAEIMAEIGRFLVAHGDSVEERFEEIFRPDIIPAALSGSTRAFLEEIMRCLAP